jgi:hypothetical protein
VCRKPRPFDLVKESRTVGHDGRAALLSLRLLVSPIRPISRLEAENAALRRQLIVVCTNNLVRLIHRWNHVFGTHMVQNEHRVLAAARRARIN